MDKDPVSPVSGSRWRHYHFLQRVELAPPPAKSNDETRCCIPCLIAGHVKIAIGQTLNPKYRQLPLCAECIARYDSEAA